MSIKTIFTVPNFKTAMSWGFVLLVAFEAGLMSGWTLRSGDITRVHNEASSLVQELKTVEQK